ncbi:MAG: hypothetical protein EA356_08760 [Geminicoccaceae bacterium]|nr:MAG: hypothetical protein EA356_08760 [Geminicoccaceae bacterium]
MARHPHHDTARRAALLQWFAHELRSHAKLAKDRDAAHLVRDLERLAATLLVKGRRTQLQPSPAR